MTTGTSILLLIVLALVIALIGLNSKRDKQQEVKETDEVVGLTEKRYNEIDLRTAFTHGMKVGSETPEAGIEASYRKYKQKMYN